MPGDRLASVHSPVNDQLSTGLKVSTVTHAVLLGTLLVVPVVVAGFRRAPQAIPVEFTVAVPQAPSEPWVKPSPPAPVQHYEEEDVVMASPSAPRARTRLGKAPPTTSPQQVQRSRSKVTRYETVRQSGGAPKTSKALSQKEIQRLLAMGAKPSDTTSIPTDEALHFETIRRALYEVWSQPSVDEAGSAVVEVEIQLGSGGAVTGWRIVRRSGIAAMDASVAAAVRNVKRIHGLPQSFVNMREKVTIAFRLEQ